jgi:hypothetical protein
MTTLKKIASVPIEFQKDGIKWLILEHGIDTSKGYFLYLHESLDEEATYDEWYGTLEKAENAAKSDWGIEKEDWLIREG